MFDKGRNFIINGGYFVDDSGHRKQTLDEVLFKLKDASALEVGYDSLIRVSSRTVALSDELTTSLMSSTSDGDTPKFFFINSIDSFAVRAYGESIARHYNEEHALLTSVFFRKLLYIFPAQGKRLVPTLAYQLCVSPGCPEELKIEILGALYAEPNIPEQSLENQFQKLIVQPLLKTADALPRALPVIFVLDSVHDCENVESLIEIVARVIATLRDGGVNAKAVITSVSYQRVLGVFRSEEAIMSTTNTFFAGVSGTPTLFSRLNAFCFPIFDFKYNQPQPVQRAIEISSVMGGFVGLPIFVYTFVFYAGMLLGLGFFSAILAAGASMFTALMEGLMVTAAITVLGYRELARFIWPRSI